MAEQMRIATVGRIEGGHITMTGPTKPEPKPKAMSGRERAALDRERSLFNAARDTGAMITLDGIEVVGVDRYHGYLLPGGVHVPGANDATWADLLRQAGVERDPMFSKEEDE